MILGFRPEAGVSGVLLAVGLLLLYVFSFSWIWTALGLWVDDTQTLSMISGWTTFPLTFLSNVFVDPATMPEFLQAFVGMNPVTLVATAIRGLMQGTVATTDITYAVIACMILIALFGPLSMYLYNHKNAV
ncbi:ABC transporter permease [Chloroflexi bacterium TSY]|nr:ABC transporter permease [Chloroflexi bacterium TSY]